MLKKTLIIGILGIITIIGAHDAYARPDCITGDCNDFEWSDSLNTFLCGRDAKYDTQCGCNTISGFVYYTCGCFSNNDCNSDQYCNNGRCVACTTCSNCTSGSWENYGTGYQRRLTKTCNCDGTCNSSYSYRCAAGYYGSSSNGTSGCTQCPWTDLWDEAGLITRSARTSAAGSTSVSSCYIAGGTGKKFYDVTGTLELTGNCNY